MQSWRYSFWSTKNSTSRCVKYTPQSLLKFLIREIMVLICVVAHIWTFYCSTFPFTTTRQFSDLFLFFPYVEYFDNFLSQLTAAKKHNWFIFITAHSTTFRTYKSSDFSKNQKNTLVSHCLNIYSILYALFLAVKYIADFNSARWSLLYKIGHQISVHC